MHNYPAVMTRYWISMSPLRTGILKTKIGQESKIDQHVGQSHNTDEKVVYTAVKARKWLRRFGVLQISLNKI